MKTGMERTELLLVRVGTPIIMPRYMERVSIVLFAVANWPKFKAAIAEN